MFRKRFLILSKYALKVTKLNILYHYNAIYRVIERLFIKSLINLICISRNLMIFISCICKLSP